MQLTPATDRRAQIFALQDESAKHPQIECAVRHFHAPGVYCREMHIPAGVCAVGQVHLHAHVNLVLGDISIVTPEGDQRITGYETFVSPAGTKRAVLAHADTWWTTVHANPDNETDLDKLALAHTSNAREQLA